MRIFNIISHLETECGLLAEKYSVSGIQIENNLIYV